MRPYSVLFLIESLHFGGSEVFLEKLLSRLDGQKFRPLVCCLLEKGQLASRIEARGVRVETLGWRLGSVPSTLSCVWRLARLLKAERVLLLQTFFYRPEILGAFAAILARTPVVVGSQHDVMTPGGRLARLLLRSARLVVRHVIANCDACRSHREKLTGQAQEDISVIHIGLSEEEVRAIRESEPPEEERRLFDEGPVVTWVGRLLRVKGPDVFLRAAASVLSRRAGTRFLMVGDGPMRAELTQLAREIGIAGALSMPGEVRSLEGILRRASTVVCSSRSEGFPTVLLEAMAAGTPVVASRVGGVDELIEDGADGLLFESGNAEQLASRITRLLTDRELASAIGDAAAAKVTNRFTFNETVRRIEGLYEALLGGAPPRSREAQKTVASIEVRSGEGDGGGGERRREDLRLGPIRVLLAVGKGRIAGTERHVLELARALDPSQARVSVLVLSQGELVDRLNAEGIPVYVLEKRFRYDPLLLLRLVRFFRRSSFDIVHGHPERIACLAAKLAGVPATVMTYHLLGSGPAVSVEPSRARVMTEKLRTKFVDFTISVSEVDRDALIEKFGRRPDEIRFIANGVTIVPVPRSEKQRICRDFGLSPNSRIISTTARLTPQKGVEFLIRAMREVVNAFADAVLLVVGAGELEQQLKALSGELGLGSQVIFTGYRSDAEAFVAASELFVLPSLWEGLPYSLLEAMSAGKPVVTTTVCSHVVSDGETGLVVPPSDPQALASAIRKILGDAVAARRMGKSGREKLETQFSAERMAKETVSVYREILFRKVEPALSE
jgi:glycosyltransferase involved in cell wall biosynthesis